MIPLSPRQSVCFQQWAVTCQWEGSESLVGAQLCVDLGFHGRVGRLIYKLNATTDWPVGGSFKQQETKFQKFFVFVFFFLK